MRLNERIANSVGIDARYVDIIASRNNLYAKYYVDKKNGGKREVLQPSKELKVVQRWLLRNILNHFQISKYSFAYSKGDSVKRNALHHQESKYMLHTDITNFFPSITRTMLFDYFGKNKQILNELGIDDEDIKLILDICLYKGKYLVVGSVASPRIANMIMYEFDVKLKDKLDSIGNFRYSRYADDIVISSNNFIDDKIINVIEDFMTEYGFTMNRKKTYFMNKKCKRQVTGVVIDNNINKLTVGNRRYKEREYLISFSPLKTE